MSGPPPGPGPAGSLAEEAARLIEAVSLIASRYQTADGAPHSPGSAPECRVCPLCRVIAGLRQLRPEVVEHLAAAGEELLAAAREFAESVAEPPTGPPGGPANPGDPADPGDSGNPGNPASPGDTGGPAKPADPGDGPASGGAGTAAADGTAPGRPGPGPRVELIELD